MRLWFSKRLNRFRALISMIFVPAMVFGGLCFIGVAGLIFMRGPHDETQRVFLEQGSSLPSVAAKLDAAGVLRQQALFRAFVRLRGKASVLKAGEFDIPPHANMNDVLDILIHGDVVLHAITIVEGLTSQQIMAQLAAEDVLVGEVAIPAEGRLLPETYIVPRGLERAALVEKMAQAQRATIEELWPQRQQGLPFKTQEEALILASIVERETGIAHERPLVAAAFINRLKKGMRLQSDPTIIYGLVGGKGSLGRAIRRSEIRRRTPYNTYRIHGLPPTPISNPGRAAIAAVLMPAESDVLYFVADGSGGHVFATTLAEHNKNVRHWRQIEKQAHE